MATFWKPGLAVPLVFSSKCDGSVLLRTNIAYILCALTIQPTVVMRHQVLTTARMITMSTVIPPLIRENYPLI